MFIEAGKLQVEIKNNKPADVVVPRSGAPGGPVGLTPSTGSPAASHGTSLPTATATGKYGPIVVLATIEVTATVPKGTMRQPHGSGGAGARSVIQRSGGIATSNPNQIAELLGSIPGFDPGFFAAEQKRIFIEGNNQ